MKKYLIRMEKSFVKLLVPDDILGHFDYECWEEIGGVIRIHLVEKNTPDHYPDPLKGKEKVVLDGFMNPLELQTFPTRAKEVFLLLKRRRWKIKGDSKSYSNTYSFNHRGMKATKEFAVFLKDIGRG